MPKLKFITLPSWVSWCVAFAICAPSVLANVSTVMFQSNMVLQREQTVPVFGDGFPDETVTVIFCGQTLTTQADSHGQWLVKLAPLPAGGPFAMTIQGSNTLSLTNVMVGEVWLCAGQSNMGYSMKKIGNETQYRCGQSGQFSRYSHCHHDAQTKCPVAKSLARGLPGIFRHRVLFWHEPVCGASRADWPDRQLQSRQPPFGTRVDPATIAADVGLAQGKSVGKWYNELVKPVIPYAIRGAIWYQGESDTDGNPQDYQSRFFSLINNYRKNWNEGEFPFLYVQLASFGEKATNAGATSHWAELRDVQTQALSLSNTAMAVTIDIGDRGFHPEDKWDVGRRLALPALSLVYGRTNILEYSGPVLSSCEQKNGVIQLHFNHTYGGLVDRDQTNLTVFAVCGADHQWHWAKSAIRQDTVELTCDQVKDPVEIRYAWADCPIATPLYNGAGLPAVPFRVKLKP